jgi:hypothetical protein
MEARVRICIAELAEAMGNLEQARSEAQDALELATKYGMKTEIRAMQKLLERVDQAKN